MSIANSKIHPPRGFSRMFWRLPIGLYRIGLGWLLTSHFLMLEHVGRRSGQVRRAVIEIVKRDKTNDVYYLAAGFGPSSDWYQNLLKTPSAKIHSGFRKADVIAEVRSIEEAERIFLDYAHRYPTAIRTLARIIGYEVGKGEFDCRGFAKMVPIVALKVVTVKQPTT
ncbi:MAG: nitroreductase family deazaflavin-dependent oxidoreductase [Chloroflexota bacterium]